MVILYISGIYREMFQYLSAILSQFTPAQRILALLILVLTSVMIALGPSLIDAITLDREELNRDLQKREARVYFLERELDSLSNQIIENRRSCTNEIATREEEFVRMLDRLKRELETVPDPVRRTMRLESFGSDTVEVSKQMVIETPYRNVKALRMIEQMKSECKSQK